MVTIILYGGSTVCMQMKLILMHTIYSYMYLPRTKANPKIMNGKNARVTFVIRLAALASSTAIRVKAKFWSVIVLVP